MESVQKIRFNISYATHEIPTLTDEKTPAISERMKSNILALQQQKLYVTKSELLKPVMQRGQTAESMHVTSPIYERP
jgi:hypothetical protein